ncbi:hypothetical protein TNCV_4628701 [Trichonephila clavipes]|nr:hypothetical protein TNCV_4628701 [Trichonephila clavipes]
MVSVLAFHSYVRNGRYPERTFNSDIGDPDAVILAPDKGGVETSWKCAGGTEVDTAIGNAGAQMGVNLLELE